MQKIRAARILKDYLDDGMSPKPWTWNKKNLSQPELLKILCEDGNEDGEQIVAFVESGLNAQAINMLEEMIYKAENAKIGLG